MRCSTVSSLAINTRSSAYFTVPYSTSTAYVTTLDWSDKRCLHYLRQSTVITVLRDASRTFSDTVSQSTPWSRDLSEKLTGPQLVKFFAIYGSRRFITALTRARHLSLSSAKVIESMLPHPTSRKSILLLSSHLRLGPSSGLFPSGFPTKIFYAPVLSLILLSLTWDINMTYTMNTYIYTYRQWHG
jgi:hypothetical protein